MRQKGLFPGIVLADEELERLVSPLYPKLWRMIREPFDDLRCRRAADGAFRIMDEGETAQWLRPQIVERARQLFDGDSEITAGKKNQQFFLRWRDKFAIIPKKLRRARDKKRLTFSSYDTIQNVALWAQRAEDGLPDLPRSLGRLSLHRRDDRYQDLGRLPAREVGRDLSPDAGPGWRRHGHL